MKVRRVTLEVEVPWEFKATEVLDCLDQGFTEIAYTHYDRLTSTGGAAIPHQAQVVSDVISPITQIGSVK